MIIRATLAVALTLVLIGGSASAQVSSPIKIYAGLGLSGPAGPSGFSDNYKKGFHTMVGAGLSVFPKIEAVPKIAYYSFGEDLDEFSGGKIKAALFGIDGKVNFSVPTFPIAPYAIAGIGLAKITQGDIQSDLQDLAQGLTLEDQTKFYWNAGLGMQWKFMLAVSLFAQVHWTYIKTNEDDSAFDADTKFWSGTVGVKLL